METLKHLILHTGMNSSSQAIRRIRIIYAFNYSCVDSRFILIVICVWFVDVQYLSILCSLTCKGNVTKLCCTTETKPTTKKLSQIFLKYVSSFYLIHLTFNILI